MQTRTRVTPCDVVVCREPSRTREEFQAFVADTYARAYAARITHFLPELLGVTGPNRELLGVVGCQLGRAGGPLFLEQYLDLPAEWLLTRARGAPVTRGDVAEVGNLSASRGASGTWLVTTLAARLERLRVPWALFTATRSLRRGFRRLGIPMLELAPAQGTRVGSDLATWGSYYATNPRVMAARVADVLSAARTDTGLSALCAPLWQRARQLSPPPSLQGPHAA